MNTDFLFLAFGFTLLAGLSTGIGSLLAIYTKRTNEKALSVALGFSAGVMVYVSFMEILPEAEAMLAHHCCEAESELYAVLAFFGGIGLAALIDKLVPEHKNPHEIHHVEEREDQQQAARYQKLYRTGFFTALAIALHNFPEGMATFFSTLSDPETGSAIAVAVAIHNIPEGIAVAIPLYFATGKKGKAFGYSFLSGLAEPLGGLLGFFFLLPFFDDILFGLLLAGVAGIMVFISFDELFPTAREYGEHHLVMYGFIGGMGLMAGSLLLFLA